MAVFSGCLHMQIMQGEQGVVAHVKLPKDKELREYDRLELDFALGCPGALPHFLSAYSVAPRLRPSPPTCHAWRHTGFLELDRAL